MTGRSVQAEGPFERVVPLLGERRGCMGGVDETPPSGQVMSL